MVSPFERFKRSVFSATDGVVTPNLLERARRILTGNGDDDGVKSVAFSESSPLLAKIGMVRDDALRERLKRFFLDWQVDEFLKLPAPQAADVIGAHFGIKPRESVLLYNHVRGQKLIDFREEKHGRGRTAFFTQEGVIPYAAVVQAHLGGAMRRDLAPRARELVGNELGDAIHNPSEITGRVRRKALNTRTARLSTGETIGGERLFDQEPTEGEKQKFVLGNIPGFTFQELAIIATWNPSNNNLLKETRGMDLDTVAFTEDRFPVAQAVMFIEAAVESAEKRTWGALKAFDPSLTDVKKIGWNYAVDVVGRLYSQFPRYGDLGHLLRGTIRWIEQRAAARIEEREELHP